MSGILNSFVGLSYGRKPDAPTGVSAVAAGAFTATVSYTAPAFDGGSPITSYTATSSPGGFTGTASSGPITVSGLSQLTSYTFTVTANNGLGSGTPSSASNSITTGGAVEYTSGGTFTFVVPSGITSISAVAVGGGQTAYSSGSGAGGALRYINNYSVTPGQSISVSVSTGGDFVDFVSKLTVGSTIILSAGLGSSDCVGTGGGNGGASTVSTPPYYSVGGGGAGGYSGNGGTGGNGGGGNAGSGGGGGGGGSGFFTTGPDIAAGAGGGGGVGIYGQGANGSGGAYLGGTGGGSNGGGGGSSGANGVSGQASTPYGNGGGGSGGSFGGGGGSYGFNYYPYGPFGSGVGGAVRIVYPGTTRQFPSTNVANT